MNLTLRPIVNPAWLPGLVAALAVAAGSASGQTPVPSGQGAPAISAQADVQPLPPGTALPPGAAPAGSYPPGTMPGAPIPDCICDYWIVSSRHCNGKGANTGCLSFFHRSSEKELRDVGRDAFMASLRPDLPVCFVVHGSYNWWRDVVKESRHIHRWIRSGAPELPVQVVFFTWPSDGNMPFAFPVDIAILGRKASRHALYLANLIGNLPPQQPVCILGHSHGARAATAALHVLGGGAIEDGQVLPPGYTTPHHLRAVLIAAAIDQSWLNPGNRYGQALWPPERILLMRNSRDATLAVYPYRKFGGERAMGKDGLALQDRFQMDQLGRKIVELDAAQFAQSNHSFSDYHQHPELAGAIVPYVYFRDDVSSGPSEVIDPNLAPPQSIAPAQSSVAPQTTVPAQNRIPTQANGNVPAIPARVQPVRPILPAGNEIPAGQLVPNGVTPNGPQPTGPRLTPASLSPPAPRLEPIFEAPPVPESGLQGADPQANRPPQKTPPRSNAGAQPSPSPEKSDRASRKKWRNPFHLRVEP